MKTKSFILSCCLVFCLLTAYGKMEFHIEIQNTGVDSTLSNNMYVHITNGNVMTVTGQMHIVEIYGTYDGPADSVHWYYNGYIAGITFGSQTIDFDQPGVYTAIGYYAGIWNSQENIVLAVQNPTGIAEQAASAFSVIQDASQHQLIISGMERGKKITVEIISLSGMVVKSEAVQGNTPVVYISSSGISNGIYFVNILSEDKKYSKKILLNE
jgi:hypothetical protein